MIGRERKLLSCCLIQRVQILGNLTDVLFVDSFSEGEGTVAQLPVLLSNLFIKIEGLLELGLCRLAFELVLGDPLTAPNTMMLLVDVPLDQACSTLLRQRLF